jgi:sugar diacid utilization regulator
MRNKLSVQVDMMLDKRVIAMNLYDLDHGTAYLETACSTVEFPGSPAEAARALNVHRNTYFYRVNKISELFYLDLRKGSDRLAVAFSHRFLAGVGDRMDLASSDLPDIWGLAAERMR